MRRSHSEISGHQDGVGITAFSKSQNIVIVSMINEYAQAILVLQKLKLAVEGGNLIKNRGGPPGPPLTLRNYN